jgi:hypothetical protein
VRGVAHGGGVGMPHALVAHATPPTTTARLVLLPWCMQAAQELEAAQAQARQEQVTRPPQVCDACRWLLRGQLAARRALARARDTHTTRSDSRDACHSQVTQQRPRQPQAPQQQRQPLPAPQQPQPQPQPPPARAQLQPQPQP